LSTVGDEALDLFFDGIETCPVGDVVNGYAAMRIPVIGV
jgi:hypothetical protein